MFILYSFINGITLASIFFMYNLYDIFYVFLATAGIFGAMAFLGYTTKLDLSKLGTFISVALIGLIVSGIILMFAFSETFYVIYSILVILSCKLSKGVHRVALPSSADLHVTHINAFHFGKRQSAHLESVFGGDRSIHFLVRRQCRWDHIKNIQPHLLHERLCRLQMPIVRGGKGSSENADSRHGSSITGFLDERL